VFSDCQKQNKEWCAKQFSRLSRRIKHVHQGGEKYIVEKRVGRVGREE